MKGISILFPAFLGGGAETVALSMIGAVGFHVIVINTVQPIKQIIQFRFVTKVPAKIEKGTAHQDLPAGWQKASSLLNNRNVRLRSSFPTC